MVMHLPESNPGGAHAIKKGDAYNYCYAHNLGAHVCFKRY